MDWRERMTTNPAVCHGQACVRGTRVMAAVVLDNLAADMTVADILRSYPSLTADDVRAVMCYAADLARERTLPLPAGAP